ncbi:MAG: hypothetical protein AAB920_02815 [Patescibacteria group bacterium]
MKTEERKLARKLRANGLSIKEIARNVGVSKASASTWVRDIELSDAQKHRLLKNGFTQEAIEKRRATRLFRENAERQKVVDAARNEVTKISKENLFFIGVSLYCGEGSKTRRGIVEFSNSDPWLIQIEIEFFKKICGVSNDKLRGHIHLQAEQNIKKAEAFWSQTTGIPIKQFFKTSQQKSIASKNKRKTLPNGTLSVYVCSTKLFLRMRGWMDGLCERVFKT